MSFLLGALGSIGGLLGGGGGMGSMLTSALGAGISAAQSAIEKQKQEEQMRKQAQVKEFNTRQMESYQQTALTNSGIKRTPIDMIQGNATGQFLQNRVDNATPIAMGLVKR